MTGDWFTGSWFTGDWFTGNWFTGSWFTGSWFTGDWFTGDWFTGAAWVPSLRGTTSAAGGMPARGTTPAPAPTVDGPEIVSPVTSGGGPLACPERATAWTEALSQRYTTQESASSTHEIVRVWSGAPAA